MSSNDAPGRRRTIRGVVDAQDLGGRAARRDIRAPSRKFTELLRRPHASAVVIMAFAGAQWLFPIMTHFTWLIAVWLWLLVRSTDVNIVLPLRLPMSSGRPDLNDPKPGRKEVYKARGIFHIGNEMGTGYELWEAAKDVVMHWLVFGATGSGKTETLLSCCAANVLSMGSGLIYSDAKAAPDLPWKLQGLARRVGRDDDFLVINYITGNRTRRRRERNRLSNTSNPFAFGTADSIVQLMSSLIPSPQGDNAVFGQRAIALINAALYPLVDLRDLGLLNLGVNVIRAHMNLPALMRLALDPRVEPKSRAIVMAYLADLPGFDIAKEPTKQREEVYRQFGFAVSYFTRALSSLSDTYGHIYWTNMGEVDLVDVIVNRRILVIMLPAIEKSVEELRNLGKISLSGARQALAIGLGSRLEGTKAEVLDNIPTVGRVPYVLVADEYAYQTTEGFSVTAAQARGLNVAFVFAGQDYAGFKKASAEEAEQIISNTVTKFMMALTEAADTWKLFEAIGGEANVAQTQGFERDFDSPFIDYRDTGSANIQRVNRLDIRDAQEQIEGEAHVFFRGRLMRVEMFHSGASPPPLFRITRYLKVGEPDDTDLSNYSRQMAAIEMMIEERQAEPAHANEYFENLNAGTFWAGLQQAMTDVEMQIGCDEQGVVGLFVMADEMDRRVNGAGSGGGGQRGTNNVANDLTAAEILAAIDELEDGDLPRAPTRSAIDRLLAGDLDFDQPQENDGLDQDSEDNVQDRAGSEADLGVDLPEYPQTVPSSLREPLPDSLGIDEDVLEKALTSINRHLGHPNPAQAAAETIEAVGAAVAYPRPPPVTRSTERELLDAVELLERQLASQQQHL